MKQGFKVSRFQSFKVRSIPHGVQTLKPCNVETRLHWPLNFSKQSEEVSNFEQSHDGGETSVQELLNAASPEKADSPLGQAWVSVDRVGDVRPPRVPQSSVL